MFESIKPYWNREFLRNFANYYVEKFEGTQSVSDALSRSAGILKEGAAIECELIGNSETFKNSYRHLWNNLSQDKKSLFVDIGRSASFNGVHLELDPDNWNKYSFDRELISDFSSGVKSTIKTAGDKAIRYQINSLSQTRKKYISELPKDEAAYIKFTYNATMKAKGLCCISNEYKNITPDNANNEKINGFEVFVQRSEKSGRIIISYKDTDDVKDVKSDIQMAGNKRPEQLSDALAVYKTIIETYPNDEIIVTGHSLGGSLAELVCSSPEAKKHGKTQGFAFNSYGVKDVLKDCGPGFEDQGNVTVAVSTGDRFIAQTAEHVGKHQYLVWHDGISLDAHKLASMEDEINKLHVDRNLYCSISGIPKEKTLVEKLILLWDKLTKRSSDKNTCPA